jgi:Nif-specific regulatory protein
LGELVREGKFREDLYYRINVIRFRIPPLRERIEDLQSLSLAIIRRLEAERKLRAKTISAAALTKLENYAWPGNIRQLQNKIESALITSGPRTQLEPEDFQFESFTSPAAPLTVPMANAQTDSELKKARRSFEKAFIENTIRSCDGNKTEAARKLGLTREGLRKALLKLR